MKTLFFTLLLLSFGIQSVFAQDDDRGPTDVGRFLVETSTSFSAISEIPLLGTGLSLFYFDGEIEGTLGGEMGYFVADNLAVKVGLGLSTFDIYSSKLGVKYYGFNFIPVQVDLTVNANDFDQDFISSTWFGAQVGYAAFLNKNITLEPTLRYNRTLDEESFNTNFWEFRVGLVAFL